MHDCCYNALVDKRIVRVPWYSSSTNTWTGILQHQCVRSGSPLLYVTSPIAYGLVYLVQTDWTVQFSSHLWEAAQGQAETQPCPH